MNTGHISTFVALSPGQSASIRPMVDALKEGETLMAKVFVDGLKIRVLTPDETQKIRATLGATDTRLYRTGNPPLRKPIQAAESVSCCNGQGAGQHCQACPGVKTVTAV